MFKGTFGMFRFIIKVFISQYHTMLSSLRSILWAYHTDAPTHSIPHTMISSLLPVGEFLSSSGGTDSSRWAYHIDALFTLRVPTR